MEDIIITLRYSVNLDRGVVKQRLPVDFGTGDKEAHRIILTACRNDGAVDLTGAGVLAYVNRSDGTSVLVDGAVEDGKAVVLLPEAAYAAGGVVSVVVKVTLGDVRATVLWLDGNINRTSNDTIIDPGKVLPSLEALLAEIDNMRSATAEAVQTVENAQTTLEETASDAQTAIHNTQREAVQTMAATQREAGAALNDAAESVRLAAEKSAPAIMPVLSGLLPSAADAAERPFLSLRAFGRSTQDETPAPEKPVVIQNPGSAGTLTISVMGENLFPGGPVSQVTYTGSDGTKATRWGYAITLPAGTYTLWAIPQAGASDDRYLYGSVNNVVGEYTGNAKLVGGTSLFTQVITAKQGDVIYLYDGNATDLQAGPAESQQCFTEYAVQIVHGQATTDGAPPADGGSVTINVGHGLHAIPVHYGGNYVDASGQMWLADEINADAAVIIRRVGVRTINSATKSSNNSYNVYNISTSDWGRATGKDVVLVLSHYPYNGTSEGSSALKSDAAMLNSGSGSLYLGHNSISTADAYNAWLAAQEAAGTPVTVLYPLEAPVEEPMTDEEADASKALHSICPVTTINAGGAWIVAQYIADTKIYIDNQISAIAARMINV